jgi:probable addiction module antidote protein
MAALKSALGRDSLGYPGRPFTTGFCKKMKSDAAIAEYLNEALRVQDPKFLLVALGDVARARGMSEIARDTGLGRENLYKALSSRANPRIETIFRVAAALGVRFEVRVA